MKVEIWSDIVCPFCYIGKRKFENALTQFEHKDKIEVIWHSYQLDPDLDISKHTNIYMYLAERKGMSLAQSIDAHKHVTEAANSVGLDYSFDNVKIANTFDGHRLIHFAKSKKLANECKEALLKAYFINGQNINDFEILAELGESIGLAKAEIISMLKSEKFKEDIHSDIDEARRIGVRGVPFFVFDRKYAVSGAQASEIFLKTLRQSFTEQNK